MLDALNSMRCFRPEEESLIPNKAGVYAFIYNPFQAANLGLYTDITPSSENVSTAREALKKKLQKYNSLRSDSFLEGKLKMRSLSGAGRQSFQGKLSYVEEQSSWFFNLDSLSDDEFLVYLKMAELSFPAFQPLYCGMTVEQGLQSRYIQHRNDYEREREGTFGGRIGKYSNSWRDIFFLCMPVSAPSKDHRSVKVLEKHLIHLFQPLLSIR